MHEHFPIWDAQEAPWTFVGATRDELLPLSIESSLGGVRILSLEPAAMVIAAAVYQDSIEHPLWRPATVRLSDIIDYADLTNRDEFDRMAFQGICERFQASHCMRFLEHVIELLAVGDSSPCLTAPMEIARGIYVSVPLRARAILRPSVAFDAVLSALGTMSSWDGRRPDRSEGAFQIGGSAESARITEVANGIKVSHVIVGGAYKEELRVTTRSGSSAIQLDHRNGDVLTRSSGNGLRLKAATCSGSSLTLQLELDRSAETMIIGHSNMAGVMNNSWSDFYAGLASGVEVVDARQFYPGWKKDLSRS